MKRGFLQSNSFIHVESPVKNVTKKRIVEDDSEDAENFYTREQLIKFLSCLE